MNVTAALDNDNYRGRLSVAANDSGIKIIDRLVDDACNGPDGNYQLEWKIKDGVIQDIKITSPFTGKPAFSHAQYTTGMNVYELHKQTLVDGWHGQVNLYIESRSYGGSLMSATTTKCFRP